MADHVILQTLSNSPDADRILDEFERRTGLEPQIREDGRSYELRGDEHRVRIVQTLTDIDAGWTDLLGLKLPA